MIEFTERECVLLRQYQRACEGEDLGGDGFTAEAIAAANEKIARGCVQFCPLCKGWGWFWNDDKKEAERCPKHLEFGGI
jgi:hypothetical protein